MTLNLQNIAEFFYFLIFISISIFLDTIITINLQHTQNFWIIQASFPSTMTKTFNSMFLTLAVHLSRSDRIVRVTVRKFAVAKPKEREMEMGNRRAVYLSLAIFLTHDCAFNFENKIFAKISNVPRDK